ncbi:HD domain-containing protein [[Mycobacterium] nativiensis]|uniref:HD domain-containing protein n=1 Tax=[Mycobacterium] nativiensis TaxID=2855503 RepID=A0ABU5XV03_9MYCO|nr:HD domain-containing protein [Mycolicibacter sp. MYC340]MEB3031816.1 HD domain-containing protein [Mycolicibacter sp. MYC340]
MGKASQFYHQHTPTDVQRREILDALPQIEKLPADLQELTITAWACSWLSSPYQRFLEIPMAIPAPDYSLIRHIGDTATAGLALMDIATQRLGRAPDHDTTLAAMLLHDLDSSLIYDRVGDGLDYNKVGRMIQHGVLGAMILRDLDAPDDIVSLVATHALSSPFHPETPEAWVLSYADLFCADHALMKNGSNPIYRRKAH